MVSRRAVVRGAFAAVVFVALLSLGLGYAAETTSRGDPSLVGDWWLELIAAWEAVLPAAVRSALFSVLPAWFGYAELTALAVLAVTLVAWAAAEARWAGWTVRAALAQVRAMRASRGDDGDGDG